MLETQTAREILSHLLVDIQDIDDSVIRGEKRLGSQTYAVAYVDLADAVVKRSKNLREFQERILGDDFFDAPGDLRWNKYLYLVAGPNSISDPDFAVAKANIEADKDYARKRVVSESDLESLLGGAKLFEAAKTTQTYDVLSDWEHRLTAAHLDLLLDCPTPRTSAVERIAQGIAHRAATQPRAKTLNPSDQHLAASKLSGLTVSSFRPIHDGKTYQFGDVTLIVGANGTGKTSLLEAVEYLYCGNNRRSNSTNEVRLKATLTKRADGSQYDLASTTDGPRIKARCLAWYNREERNVDSIVTSFSLYNFLDTDAAFRLSGHLQPADVTEELSRLLVGSSAATTYDYFEKIYGDIEKAEGKLRRDIDKLQDELDADVKHLKELQERPSTAKALTDSYRNALADLRWLQISQHPTPQTQEGNALLDALGHLQVLLSAGASARTISDIHQRSDELSAAVEAATSHGNRLSELTRREELLVEQIAEHNAHLENLDRWLAYSSSGFHETLQRYPVARQTVQQLVGRLGNFVAGELPQVPSPYDELPLAAALLNARDALIRDEKLVAETQKLINLHGKAAATRAETAARLKAAALEATRNFGNPDTCPVCLTVHPAGNLLHLIEELTSATESAPELNKLTEVLRTAEGEVAHTKSVLETLDFAHAVASNLSLSTSLIAPEIFDALAALRTQANNAKNELQQITKQGQTLNEAGFSSNENDLLWGHIRHLFANSEQWPTAEAIGRVRQTHSLGSESKRKELGTCRQAMEETLRTVRNICETISMNGWNTRVQPVKSFASLVALRDEFATIAQRVDNLLEKINLSDHAALMEIQVNISSVATAFKQAEDATQIELQSSEALQTLPQKIADKKLVLDKVKGEAQALQKSIRALKEIFDTASLGIATAEALIAIGEQINEVFTRIHSPGEYEYVGSREVLLQTIEKKERRSLDEVSTGQRAAFALSIFLARNRTAISAPPILLIDDPIAHIDDLNALSFLDYLRDLAVNSGRQIFFATADTRIASLFSRKFSFLGEGFKTINLTRATVLDTTMAG